MFALKQNMKAQRKSRVIVMLSLISTLDGSGHRHATLALPLGKRPGCDCAEERVGPGARLDGCGKSRPAVTLNVHNIHKSIAWFRQTLCTPSAC